MFIWKWSYLRKIDSFLRKYDSHAAARHYTNLLLEVNWSDDGAAEKKGKHAQLTYTREYGAERKRDENVINNCRILTSHISYSMHYNTRSIKIMNAKVNINSNFSIISDWTLDGRWITLFLLDYVIFNISTSYRFVAC